MEEFKGAAALCFGGAAFLYLWSYITQIEAQTMSTAIYVKELQDLEELLGDNNNTSSLVVAISGKVGSNEAFKGKRSGVLCVSLTEKAKLVFSTKDQGGYSKIDSEEIRLSRKTVPWFLEDDTGRVNVVGFYGTFNRFVFAEPVNELFQRVLSIKGVEVVRHTCSEEVLEIGAPLTIVAEAFRGRDGTHTIRASSSQVFKGYINVDEELSNMEFKSMCYLHLSYFLATTGVVLLIVPSH